MLKKLYKLCEIWKFWAVLVLNFEIPGHFLLRPEPDTIYQDPRQTQNR